MSRVDSIRQSEAVCRRLARSHYENFLVASILLPRRLRQPFYNIYAFCRTADDIADESPDPAIALERLEAFQQQLDDTFRGNPPKTSHWPALADTIDRFAFAQRPFDDLLSAFRQDQHVFEYETTEQLIDYCERSANPVGRIVLKLAGSLSDETAPLSDKICTGLQLANFWQDVGRDYQIGRIYLPVDLREQFGVETQMLRNAHCSDALKSLLSHLCDQADSYFDAGLPLVDHVPRWLAGDVKLFAHGGKATLRAIRRVDFDVLAKRPTVGKHTQMLLVGKVVLGLI